jgi:hypothetical protein
VADSIVERYGGIAERSRRLRENPEQVIALLRAGTEKARLEARKTMAEVRRAIKMDWE